MSSNAPLRRKHLALFACIGYISTCLPAYAEPIVKETIVGPVAERVSYYVSPTGAHLASIQIENEKYTVTYDGSKGPAVDSVITATEVWGRTAPDATEPIMFSEDGKRYAYVARQGDQMFVAVDGKEIWRAPYEITAVRALGFSAGGKHVFFEYTTVNKSNNREYIFFWDGKPGPASSVELKPTFSPDGDRYAYVAASMSDRNKQFLVIDGKEAGYFGYNPVFSADSKQVLSLGNDASQVTLQEDGKELGKFAAVDRIWVSHKGKNRLAASVQNKQGSFLWIDGQVLDDAPAVTAVTFSPDGSRYFAEGTMPGTYNKYMMLDGKIVVEEGCTAPMFSPDSSRFACIVNRGMQQFVYVDGMELGPFAGFNHYPAFAGAHTLTFVASDAAGDRVYIDEEVGAWPRIEHGEFTLSPDGKRFALATGLPPKMVVDGELLPEPTTQGLKFDGATTEARRPFRFKFSDDSRHLAYRAQSLTEQSVAGLTVDGTFMPLAPTRILQPLFTPDGQHVFWAEWHNPNYVLKLDGRVVSEWAHHPQLTYKFDNFVRGWHMDADGTLNYLAPFADGIKRISVTPSDETNLASMFQEAAAAQTQAKADAEAARVQAEQEKAQAAADAKAAAAQKQAEQQAAREAQLKARQEAYDAKLKARDEAIAAKQKAREEAIAAKTEARRKQLGQ